MRRVALFCSLLLLVGACSGASEDATTPPEDLPTTTSVDPPVEDESARSIAVATSAVDAWNSLDYATFRTVFDDGGLYDGYPIDSPDTESEIDFWMGLGGRIAISECTEIDAGMVACFVSGFDDLAGAVGHGFESRIAMTVAGERLSEFVWWPIDRSKIDYTAEMVAWVRDAHPDVFAATFADETCGNFSRLNCWGDWAASAAAAEALLDLHTEYEAWLASDSGSAADAPLAPSDPPTAGAELDVGDGPLVYTVMGNSLMFTPWEASVMSQYEAMLAEDFGVAIDVRDHTMGSQSAADFLDRLKNSDLTRSDLEEADVVMFVVPFHEWVDPWMTFSGDAGRDPADCGGDDGQQCLRDAVPEYNSLVDQIYAELMTIVDPAGQVILVQDFYQFHTERRTETTEVLHSYFEQIQRYTHQVAAEYGIPVARVWDDFMGSDDEIPDLIEAGLVQADGSHLTPDGATRIANLYHDLGYTLTN